MLVLSSLGILVSLFIAIVTWLASTDIAASETNTFTLVSLGVLAFFIGLLMVPSLVLSIRKLRGKEPAARQLSLFRQANYALIAWAIILAAGYFLNKTESNPYLLSAITVFSVAIPIWWLIEFSRRGLSRPSAIKEWGTFTVGLTAAPLIIILLEMSLVVLVSLLVMILLGIQPGVLTKISSLVAALRSSQAGSMDSLDQLLWDLSHNTTFAIALFLVIGLIAPFIEEVFKPMAVWISKGKSLKPSEGFALGLISGGAFTLLESAGLVIQITAQDWISAVLLRAATGMLHIGMSGLVGYGIVKARSEHNWGTAILYTLGATALHGLWNSMAIINGYYSTPLTGSGGLSLSFLSILSVAVMVLDFMAVLTITLRLGAKLRKEQAIIPEEIVEEQ